MEPVFGLVKDYTVRAVDHIGGNFFTAMRRQAVQEDAVLLCDGKGLLIDLISGKILLALFGFALLAHAVPYIGIQNVCITAGLQRIGADGHFASLSVCIGDRPRCVGRIGLVSVGAGN